MLTRVILFMYYQSWGQLTQVIFDVTWSLHKLIWLKYPVWNWKKPVWNVKRLINLEFDYARLPHPIQINPTIRVQFKMISRTYYTVSVLLPMFIKNGSLRGMRINVIHNKPHILSLRPFKFFFHQLYWFLWLSCSLTKCY